MGMKITVLDAAALGEDLDLSPLNAVGDVTVWNRTAPEEVRARRDARAYLFRCRPIPNRDIAYGVQRGKIQIFPQRRCV